MCCCLVEQHQLSPLGHCVTARRGDVVAHPRSLVPVPGAVEICAVPCRAMALCHSMPCCATPCHAVPCHFGWRRCGASSQGGCVPTVQHGVCNPRVSRCHQAGLWGTRGYGHRSLVSPVPRECHRGQQHVGHVPMAVSLCGLARGPRGALGTGLSPAKGQQGTVDGFWEPGTSPDPDPSYWVGAARRGVSTRGCH